MRVKNQWNKPVFITENGVAYKSDKYRAPFIVAHLQQIKITIDDGADTVGYLHWSLMDNYEWQWGYTYSLLLLDTMIVACKLCRQFRLWKMRVILFGLLS
jgi:beta-glucosidase